MYYNAVAYACGHAKGVAMNASAESSKDSYKGGRAAEGTDAVVGVDGAGGAGYEGSALEVKMHRTLVVVGAAHVSGMQRCAWDKSLFVGLTR